MDAFVSRKRRKLAPSDNDRNIRAVSQASENDESTEMKLAMLASLHSGVDQGSLLEALLASDGCVVRASETLAKKTTTQPPRKKPAVIAYQSSISTYAISCKDKGGLARNKGLKIASKKGKTLHLYSPEDIERHTPCSIIHNFLPSDEADALLRELLQEVPTFGRQSFKLFDNVVQSPHTMCFYVDSWDEAERQKTEYVYNGSHIKDVRRILPEMAQVSRKVQTVVNHEIERRIRLFQDGKKLKYQSPHEWKPNAAFVNCYDGGAESVGYHSDQLTYLGPHAVIGSLSLGVAREFRVRKILARHDEQKNPGSSRAEAKVSDDAHADVEGQIAIHLPHNSLLVMHASMQEEWKHSIAPAAAIDPHPIAGNKRINITYRYYKENLHPRFTPRCRCNIPTVLRCVQKKKENRGRYMWMCHAGYTAGKEGCGFFKWAEFDENGEPPWATKRVDAELRQNDG